MTLRLDNITDVVMLPAITSPDTPEGFLLGTYDLTGKLIRGFEFRRLKRIAGSHPFQKPRKKLRGLYIYIYMEGC